MADERQRMLIECQSKMMQDVMDRNREGRNEGVHGVSLADFLNTRPLPFASAPKPMDAKDWLLDTERKLNTVNCNDNKKLRYATHYYADPQQHGGTTLWQYISLEGYSPGMNSRRSSGRQMCLKASWN
jgi:hypothetical protein